MKRVGSTFLILILSVCAAHAMVHVLEGSLPCVEQSIATQYDVGPATTGWLQTVWRFPWGVGALLAGWLVDHIGAKRMLALYLIGGGVTCLMAISLPGLSMLFVSMFLMGVMGSIYHPAGLALLSHETTPQTLPKVLGWHGVFGSLGIGGVPLIAAAVLSLTHSWQVFYGVLAAMSFSIGAVFVYLTLQSPERVFTRSGQPTAEDQGQWGSFGVLLVISSCIGLSYHGVMSFLPRFLSDAQVLGFHTEGEIGGNVLAASSLILGCFGQFMAGQIAKPHRLELQLTIICAGTIPFLIGMSFASPEWKWWCVAAWVMTFFMHQPVFNSLIAKYTPRSRRSLCYGVSFAMGNGLGALAAGMVGENSDLQSAYLGLAGCALAATVGGLILWIRTARTPPIGP
ncbi:MFS transporter [Bremerella cremea]|uniref:MFS transporter n=1 Tax=Bremerella cremea TaxID=1031537 RepID=UPI0031EDCB7D